MKKLLACLFSLVLCFSSAAPVFADEFVPSVSGGGAPRIVYFEENGEKLVGYVVDTSGKKLEPVKAGCLYVVSLEDAQDKDSKISDAARKQLLDLYDQFTKKEIKLSQELPALNDLVADKFGEGNNADNMVVRDLFLADLSHKVCKEELAKEGNTLDITFEMDVEKGTFLQVATYIDGEWQLVEKVVNNNEDDVKENDGTVTVTFEDLCPVVFLVPGEMAAEAGFNWLWIILALIIAFILFLLAKKSKKQA